MSAWPNEKLTKQNVEAGRGLLRVAAAMCTLVYVHFSGMSITRLMMQYLVHCHTPDILIDSLGSNIWSNMTNFFQQNHQLSPDFCLARTVFSSILGQNSATITDANTQCNLSKNEEWPFCHNFGWKFCRWKEKVLHSLFYVLSPTPPAFQYSGWSWPPFAFDMHAMKTMDDLTWSLPNLPSVAAGR